MTLRPTLRLAGILLLASFPASAATFNVTNTNDSGAGSLRQAIMDANGTMAADTIAFNIPGGGLKTISPASALPIITEPLMIDGYSQPGSSMNTNPVGLGLDTVLQIEIAGTTAPPGVAGLRIDSSDVTIRGLVVSRFSGSAGILDRHQIATVGGPYVNLVIEGCFVGTNATGTEGFDIEDTSQTFNGIYFVGAQDFRIGGTTPGARNLIIGGIQIGTFGGGVFQGNLVGTDVTGLLRISHAAGSGILEGGQFGGSGNTIGGTAPGAGNVFALSGGAINATTSDTVIQGNFIGVDAGATRLLGDLGGGTGISLSGSNVLVGGPTPGAGNVIGGWGFGIFGAGGGGVVQGNFIGTDPAGVANFGNSEAGIDAAGVGGVLIGGVGLGEGNLIAYNGDVGVEPHMGTGRSVEIRGNRMFFNGFGLVPNPNLTQGLGIDFGSNGPTVNDAGDADGRQNCPVLISATPEGGGTRVIGTLHSTPSSTFVLDFYSNPVCRARPRDLLEGETWIDAIQVNTDGSGDTSFNALLSVPIVAGSPVTVTATSADGRTSEFSREMVFRSNPGSGAAAGGANLSIAGESFLPGATVSVGGVAASNVNVVSEALLTATAPVRPAGSVNNIVVTNPGGASGTLRNGYVAQFADVPFNYFGEPAIGRLVAGAITVGCGGSNYCPVAPVTRAQMAVFLLRGRRGACYVPPPATGTVFGDVPQNGFAAAFIEQLAAEGVTGGCGGGNYCPDSPVTRQQMAVFLLKMLEGRFYLPPDCVTANFVDVPCSHPLSDWIYELARRLITGGCGGGNYCPAQAVTRGQMAVFISTTFGLP